MRRYIPKAGITDEVRQKLDFVVSVHGPGIKAVSTELNRFKARYAEKYGVLLSGGHAQIGHPDPNYMDISLIKDSEKLPDVIGGMAFGEFIGESFKSRFINTGIFKSELPKMAIHPLFRDIPLTDASGSYHIYGACAFTFLVDKRKLGGLPVPRTWEQLLDPMYENRIVLGFNIDDINEVHLLYIYKLFGKAGLQALVRNLSCLMDTLDMMRLSLREPNRNAVYLLPHFFAEAAPKEPYMEIVWPEDGALLCPLYYLARNFQKDSVREICSFLTGVQFGRALAEKNFFHICSEVRTEYDEKKFLWLGWDYVLSHDIISLMKEIDSIIVPSVIEKFPGIASSMGRALWNG